jgi:hypothetical protein
MDKAIEMVRIGALKVTPNGEVWRIHTLSRTGRLIKIPEIRADIVGGKGYRIVNCGKNDRVFAHKLVWTVLVGKIPTGMEINHLNGDKADNNPCNLELTTRGGNIQHAYDFGLRKKKTGPDNPNYKINKEKSDFIFLLRKDGWRIDSIAAAIGVNRHTVGVFLKKNAPELCGHLDRIKNLKKHDSLPWGGVE